MQLKAALGPVQLIFYSVGVIIGAGVYSVIGAAAGVAGEGLWLSFVIGAVVAALTALSYAEMSTALPTAGAEYVYIRRALPEARWVSTLTALLILFGGAATATTVAVAFGGYMQVFLPVPPLLSAAFLLILCTVVNIWGIREASWVNVLLTAIEIAGLLIVIAAGITAEDFLHPLVMTPSSGVLPAAALIFFVYLGFEEVANLAEEVRDPGRAIPRALFISLGITTALYVLVALAAIALAPPAELAASGAPLAAALRETWPKAAGLLGAIALFATANTVLITLIATSRLAFSMAREGDLPAVVSGVGPRRQTPWAAAILLLVLSVALLPLGDLKFLAELSSLVALLAFLSVNVSLIVLRYRLPALPRPFRVPWSVGRLPVPSVIAIASIVLLMAAFDLAVLVVASLLLLAAAGLAVWRFAVQHRGRS